MNINDYLIDQTGFDWQTLLSEWHWLLPPQFSVWLLTRAGDLFITVPDGSIHMLDVGAGELRQVAESRDGFCTKIDEPGVGNDWLMIPIVDELVASGVVLGPGQCLHLSAIAGSRVVHTSRRIGRHFPSLSILPLGVPFIARSQVYLTVHMSSSH